jgi:hypothetical protein
MVVEREELFVAVALGPEERLLLLVRMLRGTRPVGVLDLPTALAESFE